MGERRQLGEILLESGHITEADVNRAMEYQRAHGGFFGQALIALGIVSRQEIDWAVANQHDLPFIFPNADAIDRDAARLVPADWALAHLAVPIVRAGDSLTVVVADPLQREVIDELNRLTGCTVELALASSSRIRELIHAVYDTRPSGRSEEPAAVTTGEFLDRALEHGADRFGVSIRGSSAAGWWRGRDETHRVPLTDSWADELRAAVQPFALEGATTIPGGRADWDATLRRPDRDGLPVAARALAGAGGVELVFRLVRGPDAGSAAAGLALPQALVTELRLLWRGSAARIGVRGDQPDVVRAVLPLLPSLALGDHTRAAHINESGQGPTYTVEWSGDEDFADLMAGYELDAITVDVPPSAAGVRKLLDAAPLCFARVDGSDQAAAPAEWSLNWMLTVTGEPGSHAWDLRALHR
jgi:hypothetical protein